MLKLVIQCDSFAFGILFCAPVSFLFYGVISAALEELWHGKRWTWIIDSPKALQKHKTWETNDTFAKKNLYMRLIRAGF